MIDEDGKYIWTTNLARETVIKIERNSDINSPTHPRERETRRVSNTSLDRVESTCSNAFLKNCFARKMTLAPLWIFTNRSWEILYDIPLLAASSFKLIDLAVRPTSEARMDFHDYRDVRQTAMCGDPTVFSFVTSTKRICYINHWIFTLHDDVIFWIDLHRLHQNSIILAVFYSWEASPVIYSCVCVCVWYLETKMNC